MYLVMKHSTVSILYESESFCQCHDVLTQQIEDKDTNISFLMDMCNLSLLNPAHQQPKLKQYLLPNLLNGKLTV